MFVFDFIVHVSQTGLVWVQQLFFPETTVTEVLTEASVVEEVSADSSVTWPFSIEAETGIDKSTKGYVFVRLGTCAA